MVQRHVRLSDCPLVHRMYRRSAMLHGNLNEHPTQIRSFWKRYRSQSKEVRLSFCTVQFFSLSGRIFCGRFYENARITTENAFHIFIKTNLRKLNNARRKRTNVYFRFIYAIFECVFVRHFRSFVAFIFLRFRHTLNYCVASSHYSLFCPVNITRHHMSIISVFYTSFI